MWWQDTVYLFQYTFARCSCLYIFIIVYIAVHFRVRARTFFGSCSFLHLVPSRRRAAAHRPGQEMAPETVQRLSQSQSIKIVDYIKKNIQSSYNFTMTYNLRTNLHINRKTTRQRWIFCKNLSSKFTIP